MRTGWVLTREHVSGACFRSKLLRVYWLGFLPGSMFRERVSGASSLVCTGWGSYPRACCGSVFQEQASSCVLVDSYPRACCGSVFQEQAPSCVLVGVLTRATPGHLTRVELRTVGNLTQDEARPVGHLTSLPKLLLAVGNKRISQFFASAREPRSRVVALVDSTWVFSVVVVLYSYIVEYVFV